MPTIAFSLNFGRNIAKYRDLLTRLHDKKPVLKRAVNALVRDMIKQQFQTQGASGGSPWPALAPSTSVYKALAFPGTETLERTGKLKRLFINGTGMTDLTFSVGKADAYQIRVGGQYKYWKYHQYGAPAANLPVRQIIPSPIPPGFLSSLKDIVRTFLVYGDPGGR